MEEKIKDEMSDEEIIKEEAKLKAEEAKKEDPGKALKSWFEKKPEEEKREEPSPKPVQKESAKKSGKKPINWRRVRFVSVHILAVLALVASVGANVCLYRKYKALKNKPAETTMCVAQNTDNAEQEKIDKIASQVEKLAKLMNVDGNAPSAEGASAVVAAEASAIKVAIYNGTTTAGLAKEMETTLKAKLAGTEVVALDNAKHNDYNKTSVVAIGGKVAEAQKVAQAIGAQFSLLPLDENKPNADVLIVVGK